MENRGQEAEAEKTWEETCSVDTEALCGWMNELMMISDLLFPHNKP
jgi:hypothetical protein